MTEQTNLIHQWMASPQQLNAAEKQALDKLLEQYPYLVPARWMQAAQSFAEQDFSKEMLNESQLFMGNWMLFYKAMHASKSAPKASFVEDLLEEVFIEEEQQIIEREIPTETLMEKESELIQPLFVDNYFQHQGIEVADNLPDLQASLSETMPEEENQKSLMVMMGFDEWLLFLKKKNERKESEEADKAHLRSIWQREKLAAAIGEEDDNIPEAVFEMAINSIDKQDIMVSEPLAEIHIKQGKYEKAIEIYRKLSLLNPEKKAYFAAKINNLNKEN